MIQFQTIIPVSLFKKDTKEYLTRLEVMNGPILLTIHGRGAFVMEHINSYMHLAQLAEIAQHQRAVDDVIMKMRDGPLD